MIAMRINTLYIKVGLVFVLIVLLFMRSLDKQNVEDPNSAKALLQFLTQALTSKPQEKERKSCPLYLVQNKTAFMDYFNNIEANCRNWRQFGKNDGLKYVCMDSEFNIKPGNCNVLSFGINNEWSFDDELDKFGCKVFSFDPTMNKEDHDRSANIKFFKLGIGSIDGKQKVGMYNKFTFEKVNRYDTILRKIGLLDAQIDYIKMDVEYSEIDFFADMFISSPHLLKNVKQIGMEVHHGSEEQGLGHNSLFQKFWLCFQLLKCHGFKLMQARVNFPWHEVIWVRYDKW